MPIKDCIAVFGDNPELADLITEKWQDNYDTAAAALAKKGEMDADAIAIAATKTADNKTLIDADVLVKVRAEKRLNDAAALELHEMNARAYTQEKGGKLISAPYRYFKDLFFNIDNEQSAATDAMFLRMSPESQKVLRDFGQKMAYGWTGGIGQQRQDMIDGLVNDLFWDGTGARDNRYIPIGNAVRELLEIIRADLVKNGINVRYRQGYIIPQGHDAVKIRAHYDRWKRFLLGKDKDGNDILNWNKVYLNEAVVGDNVLLREKLLDDAWDAITTLGDNKPTGDMASKRLARRTLIFNKASGYKEYHEMWGNHRDGWDAIMGLWDGAALDIATVRTLGNAPMKNLAKMEEIINRINQQTIKNKGLSQRQANSLEADAEKQITRMRDILGHIIDPRKEERGFIPIALKAMRGLSRGAYLGVSATDVISSDTAISMRALKGIGIKQRQVLAQRFVTMMRSIFGKGERDKAWLAHTGFYMSLTSDHRTGMAGAFGREADSMSSLVRVTEWLGHVGLKASSNPYLTEMGRRAAAALIHGKVSSTIDMPWERFIKEEADFAEALMENGMTKELWERLAKYGQGELAEGMNGFSFGLYIHNATKAGLNAADIDAAYYALKTTIANTQGKAVLMAAKSSQAALDRPKLGKTENAFFQSMALFYTFTQRMTDVWMRPLTQRNLAKDKSFNALLKRGYGTRNAWMLSTAHKAAPVMATFAVGGVISMWMKDMWKGKEPRAVFDTQGNVDWDVQLMNFTLGVLRGGIGGWYGSLAEDAIYARALRKDAGEVIGEALAGATGSGAVGFAGEAMQGDDVGAVRELLKGYMPLNNNWFLTMTLGQTLDLMALEAFDPKRYRRTINAIRANDIKNGRLTKNKPLNFGY